MSTSVRVTVEQYDEMIRQGRFEPREDHRVELIEGEVVAMSPVGERHEDALDLMAEWSGKARPEGLVRVRVQQSLGIPGLASVPQPDLAWVRRRSYRKKRPTVADVLLLVEVAETSLAKDRGQKARIYAAAGVADYWVVNVPDECVEVRRSPRAGVYESIRVFSPGDAIPLIAFPDIAFPVAAVFPGDEDA